MKVCVWMHISGEYHVPQGQLMIHQGKVLTGIAPYHAPPIDMEEPALEETTVGELCAEYGLDTELHGFTNERRAWMYTDHHAAGSLTMVLIQWPD